MIQNRASNDIGCKSKPKPSTRGSRYPQLSANNQRNDNIRAGYQLDMNNCMFLRKKSKDYPPSLDLHFSFDIFRFIWSKFNAEMLSKDIIDVLDALK